MLVTVLLVIYAVLSVIAILATIGSIGKPRKSVTRGMAAWVVVAQGLNIAFYAYLLNLLHR